MLLLLSCYSVSFLCTQLKYDAYSAGVMFNVGGQNAWSCLQESFTKPGCYRGLCIHNTWIQGDLE